MRYLKHSLFLLFIGLSISLNAQEAKGELEWITSFPDAFQESKATGKPIFAFFTGSDWCGWCRRIQQHVFKKEAFVNWAKKNVVLLELDFPRKTQLPSEQAQQNRMIQGAMKVTGFPTIWIMEANLDQATSQFSLTGIGRLGYPSGATPGEEEVKFLNDANLIMEKYALEKAQ